jgi:hypothetical protein
MKLIDCSDDTQLNLGDWITDDNGVEYFIAGYGINAHGNKFVNLIEMNKLRDVMTTEWAGHFDLDVVKEGVA